MTGYPPLNMRLHLLNAKSDEAIRVGIFYLKPERLDIYRDGDVYIHPNNHALNDEGKFITLPPPADDPEKYFPKLDTKLHGSNYMDRTNRMLYITLRGPQVIEIKTAPVVVIEFGFPAMKVDDFFEKNLISNLATYLEVPPYKVKLVNVVRETRDRRKRSLRRVKRSDDVTTFTIELDGDILNTTETNNTKVAEQLNQKADKIAADYQTGVLWEKLNATGVSFGAQTATTDVTELSGDTEQFIVVYKIPAKLKVTNSDIEEEDGVKFKDHPTLTMLDKDDAVIKSLGGTWAVEVTIIPESGKSASLSGTTTVAFAQGSCVFSDLTITGLGSHELQFNLVKPDGITMTPIKLAAKITPKKVQVGGGVETGVIVGVAVAAILLIAALGGGIYYYKRRQNLSSGKSGAKSESMEANVYENIPAQQAEAHISHPDKPHQATADSFLPPATS